MNLIHGTLFLGLLCLSISPAKGASVDGSSTECGSVRSSHSEKGMSPEAFPTGHLELISSLKDIISPEDLKDTVKKIVDSLNAITYPDAKPVDPRDAGDLEKWTNIWKRETSFWYNTYKTARDTFDDLDLSTLEKKVDIGAVASDLMPRMHKWPSQETWQEALGAYIFFPEALHLYYKSRWPDNEQAQYAVATAAHYGDPMALNFLHSMVQRALPSPLTIDEDYPAKDTSITLTIPGKAGSITCPTQTIVKIFADRASEAFVVPDDCSDLFLRVTAAAEADISAPERLAIYRRALTSIQSNLATIHTVDPRIFAQYLRQGGKKADFEAVFKAIDNGSTPRNKYRDYLKDLEQRYSEEWYDGLLACSALSYCVTGYVADCLQGNLNRSHQEYGLYSVHNFLALSSTHI